MVQSTPSVLVVEDEAGVRTLIVTLLRLAGIVALPCADGDEARDLMSVHGGCVRLLVTDVHLGPDGGVEMARELVGRYPHLRVLYVSGLAEGGGVDREVLAGRGHFIPKPFTPKGLVAKVAGILDGSPRPAPGDAVPGP